MNFLNELFQRYLALIIHFAIHECPFQANYMPEINLIRPDAILYLLLPLLIEIRPAHKFNHVLSLQVPVQTPPDIHVSRKVRLQMLVSQLFEAYGKVTLGNDAA